MTVRDTAKRALGASVATVSPQCRYDRLIVVVAHMRCGSTALSNVLCSRPDISGYGEAHIRYDGQGALGRLLVNQALRRSWSPKAHSLFDKILHDRHDLDATPGFYRARAIFVVRPPGATIRSIRKLFSSLDRGEYEDDEAAARYYADRLATMSDHWFRFPVDRRVGILHPHLISDPEATLARISSALSFDPPLENSYVSRAVSTKGGAGDPTASAKHTRIERRTGPEPADTLEGLAISEATARDVTEAYRAFASVIAAS
ncbi:sulfotransferase family protein [Jannaschia aquimarina]|uniref:Sulfotransferase family protein n=1 Tax=Jannaschia aquimarina TaxID=935700 RepID=A0A0D1EFD5_9RHOB|nr:sulfotransferase [Jannaschia aquimarina]KIT16309.1 hypothetical protein jaqu_19050 [Jannaschia aquimarina]SNT26448.1 Sulfotransferase family protein [Jannaschia aquimarina]